MTGKKPNAVFISKVFGKVIRNLRKEKGLTQEEFGILIGLHRTHVSLLERGRRDPLLSTVYEISDQLGMTLPQLMELVYEEIESD
jgi:transcriptional regulator with XRE-family HTH domain